MSTALNFKDIIDKPEWRPVANALNASAAGSCLCFDKRNNEDRNIHIYQYVNATTLNSYDVKNDGHISLGSPAMGTFGAGSGCVFVPSSGPNGYLSGGWSTTTGYLSTALPAAVGINQLGSRSNNPGGTIQGYKIRVIGNAAGSSSGKIAETYIISNTTGTNPTVTLYPPLPFTPQAYDRYEFLSGRVFMLATTATLWKWYDVATDSFGSALNVTNAPTPATDCDITVLDELYVPNGQSPGTGFFGPLTAIASGSTSITSTVSGADALQPANAWNNFQIRIIQDIYNPTSVGQRQKITANTNATSTVYSVGSWTVTPTASAQFVIEGIGDIVVNTGASTNVYTYAGGGFRADAAWSNSTTAGSASLKIPAKAAVTAAGVSTCWAFGLSALDPNSYMRYSAFFMIRGGNVATIDVLDLATLSWTTGVGTQNINYSGNALFNTGTSIAYDATSNTGAGRYFYINQSGTQYFYRYDMLYSRLEPWVYLRYPQGTAIVGNKMAVLPFIDGTTKVGMLYQWQHTSNYLFECLISR